MHVAARPNALNNFLSDVTAFHEVERVGLFGFLRQVALANVVAVTWNAEGDSVELNGLCADRSCTRLQKCVPKRLKVGGRKPAFIGLLIVIDAAVDFEIPDIVGDHAVQPAHAVTAGQHDLGARAEIINPAAGAQGGELRPRIAEVSDSVWATMLAALSRARFFVKSWKHDGFSRL